MSLHPMDALLYDLVSHSLQSVTVSHMTEGQLSCGPIDRKYIAFHSL